MHPRACELLIKRVFALDHNAAVDTYGPPDHFPFSVVFSPESQLNDRHMRSIGWLLRQIEYLNVANTAVTATGLACLAASTSLKVLTVPFGTDVETIQSLLAIPTLHRINIPIVSILPKMYRDMDQTQGFVTDHISIWPRRLMDHRMFLPTSTVWYHLIRSGNVGTARCTSQDGGA